MKTLKHILDKYEDELINIDFNDQSQIEERADTILLEKWQHKVPKGWYGFALGPIPKVWVKVIDEYLQLLNSQFNGIEIHQIKIKYGGLRFYLHIPYEDVDDYKNTSRDISRLEGLLFHKSLVY